MLAQKRIKNVCPSHIDKLILGIFDTILKTSAPDKLPTSHFLLSIAPTGERLLLLYYNNFIIKVKRVNINIILVKVFHLSPIDYLIRYTKITRIL